MIQSENAPTLCPRCVHFEKKFGSPGCALIRWREDVPVDVLVRRWMRDQTEESSWTHQGACPEFSYNGSNPHLMTPRDQSALKRLLAKP